MSARRVAVCAGGALMLLVGCSDRDGRRDERSVVAGAEPGERRGGTPAQTGGQTSGPGMTGAAGRLADPGPGSGAGTPGRTDAATSSAEPLVGRLESLDSDRVVVRLADEEKADVTLSPETRFARGGAEIARSEIAPGADVRVAWELKDGARVATRIELLDAPAEK